MKTVSTTVALNGVNNAWPHVTWRVVATLVAVSLVLLPAEAVRLHAGVCAAVLREPAHARVEACRVLCCT
jgi:hypothetical protein